LDIILDFQDLFMIVDEISDDLNTDY